MKPSNGTKAKALILSIFVHSSLVLIIAIASYEYFQHKKSQVEITVGNSVPATTPAVDVATQTAPVEPELPKALPEKVAEEKAPVKKVELPVKKETKKVTASKPVPVKVEKKSVAKEVVKESPVAIMPSSDDNIELDEKELPQTMIQEQRLAEELPLKKDTETEAETKEEPVAVTETKEEPLPEVEAPESMVDPQAELVEKSTEKTEASLPQAALQDDENDWAKELQAAALPKAQASPGAAGSGRGAEGLVRPESELTAAKGNAQAIYPSLARIRRVEGTAVVRFSVNEKGIVNQAWLQTSSGSKAIDEEALKTQKSWKYQPGKVGIFQKSWVFRLKGEPEEMPYKIRR